MSDSPTAYALAIAFGLVRDDRRQLLGDRLAELVRRSAFRISTGFAGTPIVSDALTITGHAETAGRLLLQIENPSWLYPVTMGATTTWERWDSMLEDGSINPGQMTSFNHFALGAVADWMHRALGGLTAMEPGYRRTRFAPVFVEGLDDAGVWHDTPYGRLEASWHRTGTAAVEVSLTVPPGIRVEIDLPGVRAERGNGQFSWSVNIGEPSSEGPPPLDLNAPLTAILESSEAYQAVIDELEEWDPERATSLRRSIRWTPGRTLRDPLDKVPVPVLRRIEQRLIALARS
jgi:alpha-L-rhamnosidase